MNNYVHFIKLIEHVGPILCASITTKKFGTTNIKITQIVKQKENFNFEHTFNGVVFSKKITGHTSFSLNLSEIGLIQ